MSPGTGEGGKREGGMEGTTEGDVEEMKGGT